MTEYEFGQAVMAAEAEEEERMAKMSVTELARSVVERVLSVYREEYIERCARDEPDSLLGLVKRLEVELEIKAAGMKERCHDCAYTVGTDASKSPQTAVNAKLCEMTAEPFGCHINPGLCAGWVEAVRERKEKGAILAPDSVDYSIAKGCNELLSHCIRLAVADQEREE